MTDRWHFGVEPAGGSMLQPVAKIGGQPVWLEQPQWPLSRTRGTPMTFIAQFQAPGGLAYVFMTDAMEYVDEAWEAERCHRAADGRLPSLAGYAGTGPWLIEVIGQPTGPTVAADHRMVPAPEDVGGLQFTGGEPMWLQSSSVPEGDYQFLAQLSADRLPIPVNFGDLGVGYVFFSPGTREGRFLWQN